MKFLRCWSVPVGTLGLLLVASCGGASSEPAATADTAVSAAATVAPAASATASTPAPTPAPVIGITDPEGDTPIPEADVVSAEGYVDGEVLLLVLHLARLSNDPSPVQVSWMASVWSDGTQTGVLAPIVLNTEFAWPPKQVYVSSYGASKDPTRQATALWSGNVSVDRGERTIRLTARIPGLTERAMISPGTSQRDSPTAAMTRADRVFQFPVTKRAIPLDAALAQPPVMKPVPGSDLVEVNAAGFPVTLVAPAAWPYQSFAATNIQIVAPGGGVPGVGAFLRPPRAGETPAAMFQRLLGEAAGKYVALPDDGFKLPPGFEAGLLVRTGESLQIPPPADPSAVLQDWRSSPGLVTRFIAGRSGDSIVIAWYESDGSPTAQKYADLLARIKIR